MGRTLADLKKELELIPHQIVERETADGRKVLHVNIAGHEYTPEELSAMILKEVRKRAGNPTKVVITVPAYFDDSQRQATRDAGRIAGLDVLRIVNEPTAAALAYGLDRRAAAPSRFTTSAAAPSIAPFCRCRKACSKSLQPTAIPTSAATTSDRLLMQVAAQESGVRSQESGVSKDAELLQHLRDAAEKTKIALSGADNAEFKVAEIPRGIRFSRTFTRAEFEELIRPLIDRSLDRCKAALRDAQLTAAKVDEVVLVGGSTRIPYVRKRVAEFFGKTPHTGLNPDEVVAMGAAVQADILTSGRRDMLLLDVVPLSLGIERSAVSWTN